MKTGGKSEALPAAVADPGAYCAATAAGRIVLGRRPLAAACRLSNPHAPACRPLCCLAALALALSCVAAPASDWFFLPLGSQDAPQLTGLRPEEVAESATPARLAERLASPGAPAGISTPVSGTPLPVWHRASFPHSDFDRLFPGRDAYGLYACPLDLPRDLTGRDLVLFLGVIDDADIAYANGKPVGAMGDFDAKGSAWNADREYRVPAESLVPGQNLLLVRVHDIWGLGGIVGPPAIGLALAPKDAAWSFAVADEPANAQSGRRSPSGDPTAPPSAVSVPIPDTGFAGRLKQPPALGCYRLEFGLPAPVARALTIPDTPGPILDLGPVFDAAEVRLNGALVGRCGVFPSATDPTAEALLQTARRGRCFLPRKLLRESGNALEVRVYWTGQFGGLPGTPMLLLPNQLGAGDGVFPALARDLDLADVQTQSLDLATARRTLKALVRDLDRELRRAADGAGLCPTTPPGRLVSPDPSTLQDAAGIAEGRGATADSATLPRPAVAVLAQGARPPEETKGALADLPADVPSEAEPASPSGSAGRPTGAAAMWLYSATSAGAPTDRGVRGASQVPRPPEAPPRIPGPEDALPASSRAHLLAQLRARALSGLVYLDYLDARAAGRSLVPFADSARRDLRDVAQGLRRLVAEHWTESIAQDAMQAACAVLRQAEREPRLAKALAEELPAFGTRVRYLGQDRETRGDWPLVYGGEGYVLAAMGQTVSWFEGLGWRCRPTLPGDRDVPRAWLDPAGRDIPDPRALLLPGTWRTELTKAGPPHAGQPLLPLLPGAPIRRAAWWDDHGEESAFDELGPDLLVHLEIPEGEHRLAFYCLDFDWYATRHPRQQSVLITGEDGQVLNAAWTGKFGEGLYERFAVSGPLRLTARFLKHRGACVAVSGVFFDRVPPAGRCPPDPLPGGVADSPRTSHGQARRSDDAGVAGPRQRDLASPPVADASRDTVALLAAGAAPREVYRAAADFFAGAESAEPKQFRAMLDGLLSGCTETVYQPLRAWALAAWRKRGFEETPITRHAQERLELAMNSTGTPVTPGPAPGQTP